MPFINNMTYNSMQYVRMAILIDNKKRERERERESYGISLNLTSLVSFSAN